MKPETRSIKKTMALTPTEARAIKWYGRRCGLRGLAVLRKRSVQDILLERAVALLPVATTVA